MSPGVPAARTRTAHPQTMHSQTAHSAKGAA